MITDSHYSTPKPFSTVLWIILQKKNLLHDSDFMFYHFYIFYLESYWLSDFKILVVKFLFLFVCVFNFVKDFIGLTLELSPIQFFVPKSKIQFCGGGQRSRLFHL